MCAEWVAQGSCIPICGGLCGRPSRCVFPQEEESKVSCPHRVQARWDGQDAVVGTAPSKTLYRTSLPSPRTGRQGWPGCGCAARPAQTRSGWRTWAVPAAPCPAGSTQVQSRHPTRDNTPAAAAAWRASTDRHVARRPRHDLRRAAHSMRVHCNAIATRVMQSPPQHTQSNPIKRPAPSPAASTHIGQQRAQRKERLAQLNQQVDGNWTAAGRRSMTNVSGSVSAVRQPREKPRAGLLWRGSVSCSTAAQDAARSAAQHEATLAAGPQQDPWQAHTTGPKATETGSFTTPPFT